MEISKSEYKEKNEKEARHGPNTAFINRVRRPTRNKAYICIGLFILGGCVTTININQNVSISKTYKKSEIHKHKKERR